MPAAAVLHLHDRDWVYVPADGGRSERVEVAGGDMLPGDMQEMITASSRGSGWSTNALVLQNTVEQ